MSLSLSQIRVPKVCFRVLSFVLSFFALLQIFLLLPPVQAGSFTDHIRKACPGEFKRHEGTVAEFAMRMKPYIDECGCGVVDLYNALSDNNMEIIDQLEEDMALMQSAVEILDISETLNNVIKDSPDIVLTLVLLLQNDRQTFHKLSDALSSFSRHERRQLRKNPNYFLYYLLAAAMPEDLSQGFDIRSNARRLKKRVSVQSLDAFSLLYLQARFVFPNANSDYWVGAAEGTLKRLGPMTVRVLKPYKEYLAYFLPPKEDEIPESQNMSGAELQNLRRDYMDLIIFTFQRISEQFGIPYGLKAVEHICPSVMEALRFHHNKYQIQAYLNYEFRSQAFASALIKGICQSESGDEKFETFFSMYSPYKDGHPLQGTEGNLGLVAKWFADGNLRKYIDKEDNHEHYVYSMAILPRIFVRLSSKQKMVFDDLLFNLRESPTLNALVIAALFDTTTYFDWVENNYDPFSMVTHNSDVAYGKTAQKYRYILLTSYPKDDSGSILHHFDGKSISSASLNRMMNMSIDELQEHNFTDGERMVKMVDKVTKVAELTTFAASIVAIPFTAGASAGVTAMMLTRKCAMIGGKKTIKTLARKFKKSSLKLVGKHGRKVALREAKELMGIAAKRGRKSMMQEAMKKTMKKGIHKTNKWTGGVAMFSLGAGAVAHFLANGPDSTEPIELCDEIKQLRGGE